MKHNIPPLIQQMRDNMLDASNSESIRFNYKMTIESIRDYCESALKEYGRPIKKGR